MIYAKRIDNSSVDMFHVTIIDWQIVWLKLSIVSLIDCRCLMLYLLMLNPSLKM
ncbi:hypothetical protein Gogos_001256, partial [Gossypium gossypioides]|nr:hypothetical protein [Gossypium gossypioides]